MAIKRSKQSMASQKPADQARALWLAGLGAVSIAQKRGGKLIFDLTTEGRDFQMRTQKLAQRVTSRMAEQAKDALTPFQAGLKRGARKLGAAVQKGVGGALDVLGIPSKSDIEGLTQRIAALSRQLKTAK